MRKPVPARAAHHRPLPPDCEPLENQSPTARSAPTTHSTNAMPNVAARAAAAWRPCRFHSLHTGLAAQRTETRVARRGGGLRSGQPRCARGNLKAVAEGDNEDDEGAVRSERSGPQSWAPAPHATAARDDPRRTIQSTAKKNGAPRRRSLIHQQSITASASTATNPAQPPDPQKSPTPHKPATPTKQPAPAPQAPKHSPEPP